MDLTIWYHDPEEVNPRTSFVGLSPLLASAQRRDWRDAPIGPITELFDYARPDVVLSTNGIPVCSLELTNMNPSGHNIPQRFSCIARAAELGVPAILYYPEASRRRFSDANVRYLNIRVPMAHLRLMKIYRAPSLSVFWPTDPISKLPTTNQSDHQFLADLMELFVQWPFEKDMVLEHPLFRKAVQEMVDTIDRYKGSRYRKNKMVREFLPGGFPQSYAGEYKGRPVHIDPPMKAHFYDTHQFIRILERNYALPENEWKWEETKSALLRRKYTMVFTGTLNSNRTDSEHPWPGYFSLLDVLYARAEGGKLHTERTHNLIYGLPADFHDFQARIEQSMFEKKPTATYIVDTFADLLLLDGGVIPGKPLRGNTTKPQRVLGYGKWWTFP